MGKGTKVEGWCRGRGGGGWLRVTFLYPFFSPVYLHYFPLYSFRKILIWSKNIHLKYVKCKEVEDQGQDGQGNRGQGQGWFIQGNLLFPFFSPDYLFSFWLERQTVVRGRSYKQ
eukprot:TRINITY_DN4548_c0_g1_i17.p10 TRINITY_DN4548_c0_g1~~TRINITY_DN4548_c0_g1_i17.p10  ORF type:complete len:114 (-),score=21.14 TRINITY_DN4548_c0_g1_i17:2312-2653(-)